MRQNASMKFNYPELSTLTHNDGRWYDTPKGFYPSITTILGTTAPEEKKQSLARWQESLGKVAADEFTKKASEHGTNVHVLCERYLKKQDVHLPIDGKSVPAADMASFKALKMKLDKVDEVWGQEVCLFSDELQLAGRCDLIGVYRGVPSIIDFKTSGRIKQRAMVHDYELQLQLYGHAHNEMFGTDIQNGVILMVAETGFPMEFKVPFTPKLLCELQERATSFWNIAVSSVA